MTIGKFKLSSWNPSLIRAMDEESSKVDNKSYVNVTVAEKYDIDIKMEGSEARILCI